MLVIGLTGGIAAGKSRVADRFSTLGAPHVDADRVARDVVAPGSEGLAAVVRWFGPDILDEHGNLDRGAMRQRIFSDEGARRALEELLHPRIRAIMDRQIRAWRAARYAYAIEVIPLLIETGQHQHCDRVLVVDAGEEMQIARVRARDAVSESDARAVLAQQSTRWERLRHADDVVANDDPLPAEVALDPQVAALDRKFRLLACQSR